MSIKCRENWFKVKLLCRNISFEDIAQKLCIRKEELVLLVRGEKENKDFTKWVVENLGKPYWL